MSTTPRKSTRTKNKAVGRRAVAEGKVWKEFWLYLVAFRQELAAGTRALARMRLSRID